MDADDPRYPAHWEADVVLADGGVAHVRLARTGDADALRSFYGRVSDASLLLRFFGNHAPQIEDEVHQLIESDQVDRVGLVMTIRDEIVAVVRYVVGPGIASAPPADDRSADVAFLVRDDVQGGGIASLLLEHLAEVGRERGVRRFFAEMLPENRRMIGVFRSAGYRVKPALADGNVVVDFAIEGTPEARSIMEQRERRAESAAIRRLVGPGGVGLAGPAEFVGPLADAVGAFGYPGRVAVAHRVTDLPPGLDLIVVPGGADAVGHLEAAAERDAHGLLMLAPPAGPAMTPELGRALVSRARALDLRVLGPAALALINTAEGVRLNVSPAAAPRPGVVGLFTQSAGVGTIMLAKALSMGLGLSTFLSTGSYADVTANDVMQFWAEDDRTQVCLLSLDRVGNPRKFVRILRELIRRKPVVVFTPSRALRSARWDHAHELPSAPAGALDQVIEATGAIVVSQRDEMFGVARILARQPVPTGRRVRVVSNSPGLVDQADAAAARPHPRRTRPPRRRRPAGRRPVGPRGHGRRDARNPW